MEKFIERFQLEIEKKMISCINGESIVKPFSNIYQEVRKHVEKRKNETPNKMIYAEGETSIYHEVVEQFLKEHPELLEVKKEK